MLSCHSNWLEQQEGHGTGKFWQKATLEPFKFYRWATVELKQPEQCRYCCIHFLYFRNRNRRNERETGMRKERNFRVHSSRWAHTIILKERIRAPINITLESINSSAIWQERSPTTGKLSFLTLQQIPSMINRSVNPTWVGHYTIFLLKDNQYRAFSWAGKWYQIRLILLCLQDIHKVFLDFLDSMQLTFSV